MPEMSYLPHNIRKRGKKEDTAAQWLPCLLVVTLLRLERRTYCLEGSCSIQLSYRAKPQF